MPTLQVYLNDKKMAKLYYIQEEMNQGKTGTEQLTTSQIAQDLLEKQLDAYELQSSLNVEKQEG